MKLKIAVISTPVFQVGGTQGLVGYGGLEAIAFHCAKGLAARGHEVTLVAPEGSTCPGCTVIPNGKAGTWDEASAYNVYWEYLPQFDVVISHDWQKWAYVLKAEGKLKAPILGVCHAPIDGMFKELPGVPKPCFVCISEDQALHFKGLFSKDCRVAYNGVDLDFYKPLDVPRSGRHLFLARFSTVKSPAEAIEVCLRAGASLDLVGDTSITNEPELLDRCNRMADGERIRMVGPATRGECVWWHSQAHALVHLNQRFREPFGLAPVEAQACGAPVLGWDYGAMRETVKHGETGFLVNSLKGAEDLIKSGALGGLDRGRCREWASRFSVVNMVARYEELCVEAMDGGW